MAARNTTRTGAAVPAAAPAAPEPLPAIRQPEPDQRDWAMVDGVGMVAADRPYVPPLGEQRPIGGGPGRSDFACSPDDGPPLAADEATAGAARLAWPRGTSN